ncbi:phosphatase PAP2 family protein [Nonomuraea sp. NN258]|uniref:phosphatase PAP2 family protein n=1 Tax=Nonomuraea antri TaxID=2730852 RepID=UPI00156A2311|nr:phosphatase PAP2 family protein [Nonomuraea antri]NRQ37750.1 phosphatase PAP2 family protein [Nonomuraea antri]
MADKLRHYALSLVLPLLAMAVATYTGGMLLVARPNGEEAVSAGLAERRTPAGDALTMVGSSLSDTSVVVALTAVAVGALVWRRRRWREALFLVAAVWSQSLIFLATSALVARQRPPVPHLDVAPPTSGFPSGHVSAAVCCYGALAFVLTARLRGRAARAAVWTVAVAVPLVVAFSRLYRGMHLVTDVVWGLLVGVFCLVTAARAILGRPRA